MSQEAYHHRVEGRSEPSGMVSLQSALTTTRVATPEQEEIVLLVLDLAMDFDEGRRTVHEVMELCSTNDRVTCRKFTPYTGAMNDVLKDLLRAVVLSRRGVHILADGSVIDDGQLIAEGARRNEHHDGRLSFEYPIAWPWLEKPNPMTGFPGRRGRPMYAEEVYGDSAAHSAAE